MAIDLTRIYDELAPHVGHDVQCVAYTAPFNGDTPENVALECVDCSVVLLDADRPDD